jgi:hypothetical protein
VFNKQREEMKILILHRIPYHKIDYHLGIDHAVHEVTYLGTEKALANIPPGLRCRRIGRAGIERASVEAVPLLQVEDRFDRVISLSEYELQDAALLRHHFGIEGALPHEVEKVRNKLIMKHEVRAAGLAAPRFMSLRALVESKGAASWQGRTVLKPVDGASSEDVHIFDSPAQIMTALNFMSTGIKSLDAASPAIDRFECEEFIEGPILHFDGLVWNDSLIAVTGSRYIGTCLGYAEGRPLGSVQLAMDAVARAWVAASLRAVGIRNGSFHLEAIEHERGMVFLEVANRVGGADVAATFELATGVHLPSAELKILIGESPAVSIHPSKGLRYGWFVVPGHHIDAEYGRLAGHAAFASHPNMVRWNQISPDQPLPRQITYQAVEVPAAGIVRGETTEQIEEFMRAMFASIRVEPVNAPDTANTAACHR